MAYKFYNSWKNMVNRKNRSLQDQYRYLKEWEKRLEEAKKLEAEGKTYADVKYWEKEIKSTNKKIAKLEAEMVEIMANIPENVQEEINSRDEILRTFAEFVSFLEKTWNERDERLKKECDEWLDSEMNSLAHSWNGIRMEKEEEFRKEHIGENLGYWKTKELKEEFLKPFYMESYIEPRNKMLDKAGFFELSEYEKISERTIEKIRKDNKDDAEQSVISLVDRVEDSVGKVTDWSSLHFGINGMLNGRVDGTIGSVWCETIGAGGYNIQRFHYRTLLKKI